jgi:ribosome-associated heat shock protein Hsp15
MNDKQKEPVRIDKFLWAVRVYKTRGQAISAIRMGRILINGNQVKPSRVIAGDEILTIRKPPVIYTYRIISPLANRVGANLVGNFITDLTPESEKIKLDMLRNNPSAYRKKGNGRPTKKERRIIDRWTNHSGDL